jgi:hypothetical protein
MSVHRTGKALAAFIAAVAWFALVLQFYLMVIDTPAQGAARMRLFFNYFSFFTILSNLIVAGGLTLSLSMGKSPWGRFFSRPIVTSATAVYIAIVGVVYSLVLRHLWNPQGAQKVADILLHDVVPLAYVAYWLAFVNKSSLRWKDAVTWLIYPLAYFSYALVRGAVTRWNPYPFIDAAKLGYASVLLNAVMFLCAFLAVGLLAVWVGRWGGSGSPLNEGQSR